MEKKRVKCFLIRHAKTKGNLEGRYIGSRTDESLCKEGIAELEEKRSGILHRIMQDKKDDFHLVSSPMKRCTESAELLFSRKADEIAAELRETDFGAFEGKNYGQLNGTKAYQDWIDSNGTLSFPEGEAREDFIERSFKAFREVILKNGSKDKFIFVCHGGSIMSIMMELTGRDYYDFQVHPIGGFELEFEINQLAGDFKDVSYNSLDDRISS